MIVPKRKMRITIEQIRMHKWTQDGVGPPPCMLQTRAPVLYIDRATLEQLPLLGFDIRVAEQQILNNERCTAVSMYHMLLERQAEAQAATQTAVLEGEVFFLF